MWLVGPEHGRSFVVGRTPDGRYVVSKGSGLSYTPWAFLNTHEVGLDTWGLLLESDAKRDYLLGNEIASYGIKTNKMQYVLRLEHPIHIAGQEIYPHLLQYVVECPYRLSDATFMTHSQLSKQIEKWPKTHTRRYVDAAQILISNLKTLHCNGILHNALTIQNYTWALELLDFELASSPAHPYEIEEYRRHVPELMPREIIYTYQIINYIAGVLNETVDHHLLSSMFPDAGFDISVYKISNY